ncbi:MAG: hypothetical protein K2Q18_04585 [Bdellovibrionales bacterium]|nr:hypothetical protein [Bdellovibrionales bacterium]
MKYALSIFAASILFIISSNVQARTIYNFNDSDAITTVAQFLSDAAEDMPVSYRISDKKINIKNLSDCTDVKSSSVMNDVEDAIKKVMRFYPDEDLPYDQALVDLEDYVGSESYRKCVFIKKTAQSTIHTSYFVDSSDKIHLRVDNVALTAE